MSVSVRSMSNTAIQGGERTVVVGGTEVAVTGTIDLPKILVRTNWTKKWVFVIGLIRPIFGEIDT